MNDEIAKTASAADQWLQLRKDAALKIDSETAHVMWEHGEVLDPYCIHDIRLGRTVIGDRVRVTYHAVVLSGVEIGADAMVGSMGVASRPIPPGVIAAGIPAKPIGEKKVKGS